MVLLTFATTVGAASRAVGEDMLAFGGSRVEVDFGDSALAVDRSTAIRWISQSAEAVGGYFGRFPIPDLRIVLNTVEGPGIRGGRTEPGQPVTITVNVGRAASEHDLLNGDWVMVHEMIHSGLPQLTRKDAWFHEGVAVYVESIARVQAGHLSQETVFRDFVRMMPRGEEGQGGFATSSSWARTYWGGALFCLVADVEIHRRTGNRKGLQDALRAINATGDYRVAGTLSGMLATGDAATGTSVMTELYAETAEQAIDADLPSLWQSLGVIVGDGVITLDDNAPDAGIRRSIFAARP